MLHFSYLLTLIVAIICLGLSDYRYKIAFFYDLKKTLLVFIPAYLFFLLWDIAGIIENVFFTFNTKYNLRFRILGSFPLEELFFLALLVYATIIILRGASRYVALHRD